MAAGRWLISPNCREISDNFRCMSVTLDVAELSEGAEGLLALCGDGMGLACVFPLGKGWSTHNGHVLGPAVGTFVLDRVVQDCSHACFFPPLPGDLSVAFPSSLAGRHVSANTNGVRCIASPDMWVQSSPHAPGASQASWAVDSPCSCGLTSSTCLLSHGAKASTCLDDCPVLPCGGNTSRGLSSASAVTSRILASWGGGSLCNSKSLLT